MTKGQLVSVTAPHFCAGIVIDRGKVIEAAPILGWTLGKPYAWLQTYFKRKRWEVYEHPDKGEPPLNEPFI
jgi:hypothetical protein